MTDRMAKKATARGTIRLKSSACTYPSTVVMSATPKASRSPAG